MMPVIVDFGFGARGRFSPHRRPRRYRLPERLQSDLPRALRLRPYRFSMGSSSRGRIGRPNHTRWGATRATSRATAPTMEGWLGEPAGNLAFAGEHTDSFHNFQGFIEGAAQSGIRAAEYLLDRIRSGLL